MGLTIKALTNPLIIRGKDLVKKFNIYKEIKDCTCSKI